MKRFPLLAFVLTVACLPISAEEKPASPPASAETKAAKSDPERIAQLEARVAQLERVLEGLRKAAASLAVTPVPNTPVSTPAPDPNRSRGPTDEDRARYEKLSEAGKEKLRNYMKNHVEELRSAGTEEARHAIVRAAFDKITAENQPKKRE